MEKRTNKRQDTERVTLSELLLMAGVENPGLMSDCVAVNTAFQSDMENHPRHLDAIAIGVGVEGEARIAINTKEYLLRRNTLFLAGPHSIYETIGYSDFKAHILIISSGLLGKINIAAKRIMPHFMQFSSKPVIDITEEQSRNLRRFISLIEEVVQGQETEFAESIICELVTAAIYKTADITNNYIALHPEITSMNSRAEEYFCKFIDLLSLNFKQERMVGFYARQLCITPKYLTTLIKQVSGKSVSDWIDQFVIIEAKTLLRYSSMSIQEIAYTLHFPNQSFFGSYFKRLTGMSPSQYKATKG